MFDVAEMVVFPQICRPYSGRYLQSFNPKKFQKKAKEYISNRTSGVVYGKFIADEYFVIGDKIGGKRVVLIGSPGATDIASEFQTRANEWRKETGFHSSLSRKFTHPAYQRIMAMGKPALPLILRELQQKPGHWFYALRFIAGDEGKDVARGMDDLEDVRSAWLEWGYKHGYILK
jgi:hypothetical protein